MVISSKSTSASAPSALSLPDPNSNESTISTVALEIENLGGIVTAIPCDVRNISEIQSLVAKTKEVYRAVHMTSRLIPKGLRTY